MPQAVAEPPPDTEAGLAGLQTLSIFGRVLSAEVLRAHAGPPLGASDLEVRLGWASEASLRVASANLCDLGALERVRERTIRTRLTAAGNELLPVADSLEGWLAGSPFGPLELSDSAAQGIVRALVAGWESGIVGALAERPRALAELSSEISGHSYPALKRRFSHLRKAALVACSDEGSRSPRLEATPWLRRAAGTLSMACRWELRHAPDLSPGGQHDLETTLLLALPLIDLPSEESGRCVFAAPVPRRSTGESATSFDAVSLVVEKGRIVSLAAGAVPAPGTWALASPEAWMEALIEGRLEDIRTRGPDADFASLTVERVHGTLF